MRPLDRRLLTYARSTRAYLALAVILGAVTAVLVIVQARLLSGVIVDVTQAGAGLEAVGPMLVGLAAVVLGRAGVSWLAESTAYRTSARAKQELRQAALVRAMQDGVRSSGETATLITRGIDALDGYFSRYLPQLVLAVIVPLAILLTVLGQDLLSTAIIIITIPLIPMFMILIGLYTRSRVDRQWRTLSTLSGHFLDLVSGLPTLKVFGRAHAQVRAIRAIGDRYRGTTMAVLRVSFLSSLVLELLATLSVALVAVSVGLRLAEGQMAYSVALFILLLAPEAYLPLRLVGQHFHAAAEGLGAAERVFELLEAERSAAPPESQVPAAISAPVVEVDGLTVTYPGRGQPALRGASFAARPGDIIALVGPSGGGKSTVLAALLGFVTPASGTVRAPGREAIAWLPQSPRLVHPDDPRPTIRDVVRLGRPDASDAEIREALADAAVLDELEPLGLDLRLGADGTGLSQGQHRRVALARALVRRAPVLLLDEPTAALDGASEDAVVEAVRRSAARGATVIVVAHRPALVELADAVVRIGGTAAPDTRPGPDPAAESARAAMLGAGW